MDDDNNDDDCDNRSNDHNDDENDDRNDDRNDRSDDDHQPCDLGEAERGTVKPKPKLDCSFSIVAIPSNNTYKASNRYGKRRTTFFTILRFLQFYNLNFVLSQSL